MHSKVTADNYLVVGLGHIGLPVYYDMILNYGETRVHGIDKNRDLISRVKKEFFCHNEPNIFLDESKVDNIGWSLPAVSGSVLVEVAVDVSISGDRYDGTNLFSALEDILSAYCNVAIVIRSTISPSIINDIRLLNLSEFQAIYFSPEFMREGLAIKDIAKNPRYYSLIQSGNSFTHETYFVTDLYKAESLAVLKLVNNAWRAEKVAFTNLIAIMSESLGAIPTEVNELFLLDDLNTGHAYLKPGAPFGGYCLPKETFILSQIERETTGTTHFQSILEVNDQSIRYWVSRILEKSPKRVVFETLSFKPDLDDQRNSPYVVMFESIRSSGVDAVVMSNDVHPRQFDLYVDISESNNDPDFVNRLAISF